MLTHCQIFKDTQPIADWQPPFSSSGEEDLSAACQRLITRAISSGSLSKENDSNPETTTDGRDAKCATFTKGILSFHTCQIMPKGEDNPTGQDLYLVCVTRPTLSETAADDESPNDAS